MDVLHAGVEAEAAGRRHLVGGVAGQEDAAVAIALGHLRRGHPRSDAEDLHRRSGTPAARRMSAIERSGVKSVAA